MYVKNINLEQELTKEQAQNFRTIAEDFISRFNPEKWNGKGKRPVSFNGEEYEYYDIGLEFPLYIQYDYDKYDGWYFTCSLYDEKVGTVAILSGEKINSTKAIFNVIKELYLNS